MLTVSDLSPGTSESDWLGWPELQIAPQLDLGDVRRLVVVAPHPDDEVLGAAGLMRRTAREGGTVEVVAVTDGEASHPGLSRGERGTLRARRRRERAEAMRCLHLDPVVHHLTLPDGGVAEHEPQLLDRLIDLLDEGVVCVSPWRLDGHPDHDAIGRMAAAASRRTGAVLVEYPIWAWHWADPQMGLPGRLRRLELSASDRAAKAAAIDRFTSQIRPLPEAPEDGVVLPPAVLARFGRAFETYLDSGGVP